MGFIDTIKARAKADKKVIVLPETEDRRTYEATARFVVEESCTKINKTGKGNIQKAKGEEKNR